ncbi:MAG: hypothetical protein KatS3mg111_0641 [Pirellulaceae bacterium]|nr:MAG: hypothetical protein KatS3mg111_0641 [Pirellulaceae bacterium]
MRSWCFGDWHRTFRAPPAVREGNWFVLLVLCCSCCAVMCGAGDAGGQMMSVQVGASRQP